MFHCFELKIISLFYFQIEGCGNGFWYTDLKTLRWRFQLNSELTCELIEISNPTQNNPSTTTTIVVSQANFRYIKIYKIMSK